MAKKLAFGAIIGAVAGVVAGVLVAPKSGKETRGDIIKRAEDLKDKASTVANDKKKAVKKKTAEVKKKAAKATK